MTFDKLLTSHPWWAAVLPDLRRSVFVVEASHFERHTLWCDWAKDSRNPKYPGQTYKWVDGRISRSVPYDSPRVRNCDHQLALYLTFETINDQVVCFWEPASAVTDIYAARKLMDSIADLLPRWDGTRRSSANAWNFGHCLSAIDERNKLQLAAQVLAQPPETDLQAWAERLGADVAKTK